MTLEIPLDADSCCAYLGVEDHYNMSLTIPNLQVQGILALPFRPLNSNMSLLPLRLL